MSVGRGILDTASRDVVAKLRLDDTPTPRSWVARMTKRLTPTGAGKSASHPEARRSGVSMSGYAWDLSPIDDACGAYAPGHLIHWVQFNVSMRNPCAVIPVTAEVDDDGLVHIEGDDLSLVRRHHRPAVLREALRGFGGRAAWKPRWSLLMVPEEAFFGGARSVFSLATPDEWLECRVWGSSHPDDVAARGVKLGYEAANQKVWAEQEIRNAELRNIDYSHIPPLRIADRYADGRRRKGLTGSGDERQTGDGKP